MKLGSVIVACMLLLSGGFNALTQCQRVQRERPS
jgi:hypothetical protein